MIRSIFRMLWLRKKQNILLVIELFVSFLLLFGLLSAVVNNLINYFEPTGYNYNDVLTIEMDIWSSGTSEEENSETIKQLRNNIELMPEVSFLTNCSDNIPYYMGMSATSLKYKEVECNMVNQVKTDDNFQNVLELQLTNGRWYTKEDEGQKETAVVINNVLKEALFKNESAVGKVFHSGKYKVVGVVDNYKIKGEFSKNSPVFFRQIKPDKVEATMMVKLNQASNIDFEERLMKTVSSIAKDWSIQIRPLADFRNDDFRIRWIPLLIFGAICLFFIINIILGIYGILWYSINQRKAEIGLRQSVGATKNNIFQQFIFELLMIATFGMLPALIIAVQLPILKAFELDTSVYMIAMLIAVLTIYILVVLSALFPSNQATKIQPAMALHEE